MENKEFVHDVCSMIIKTKNLYRQWCERYNLNYYEVAVLYAIDKTGADTQGKICDTEGLTKQTVNSIIKNLKAIGYVELVAGINDKREKNIVITAEGKKYIDEKIQPLYEFESSIIKMIGIDKIEQMLQAVELYSMAFENKLEKLK